MSSKLEHDALYERAVSYIAALRAGRIPEKDMFRLKTDFNVAVVRAEGINFSGGSKILIRQVLDSWRRITNPHTQIKFALTDAVYAVAVEGHESWRRTTRDLVENAPHPAADGKELRDPRWKSFDGTDEQFEHLPESFRRVTDGARELDIANLPFEMLSPKWQESNIVAGMSVYSALAEAIVSAGFDASVVPVHVMTFSASAVHEVWRSEQGEWSPDLNVDYTSLPAKEMFKDADKLRLGIEAFNRWEEHTGVRFHSVI